MKHHFVERVREKRKRKSGGVDEQPEQMVVTDNYGKEGEDGKV